MGTTWCVGVKRKTGNRKTWMGQAKKDLLDTGLNLRVDKNRWRDDITTLFAGDPIV